MDASSSALEPSQNIDISKLSPQDQRELQQFVSNEMQKAKVQASVHALTDICWKKCVTGPVRGAKLDKGEESCAQNCVERFLDANFAVVRHLDKLRSGH